uniref:Uncharacterized protein n=1 Tax=Otolemur garnettii TaxID=30611 RepID=H0XT16_OTOGA
VASHSTVSAKSALAVQVGSGRRVAFWILFIRHWRSMIFGCHHHWRRILSL